MNEYEKIKSANKLNKTTQDLLHLINDFGEKLNLKKVTVHFADINN